MTENNNDPKLKETPRVWSFLKNPLTSSLIGIFGIVIGVLIGIVSIVYNNKERLPYFTTTPPEIVAKANINNPRLTLQWDGKSVPNVMSVKLAFWNGGNEFIDPKDFFASEQIKIVPSKKIKLLHLEQIRTSSEKLQFKTTVSPVGVPDSLLDYIQVNIVGDYVLEKNDGVLFYILYSGADSVKFSVTGGLKGVPDGFKEKEWGSVSQISRLGFELQFSRIILIMNVILLVLYIVFSFRIKGKYKQIVWYIFVVLFLAYIGYDYWPSLNSNLPSWIY